MSSYFDGMLRYFELSGRSTRRQYWLFWLIATLLMTIAIYADYILHGALPTRNYVGPFAAFSAIIHIVPGVTVTIRRLHDTGRSGWWYWVQFVPVIGSLLLLFWMVRSPTLLGDAYGPDPRHGSSMFAPRGKGSTIPRQVRMGNGAPPMPAHLEESGGAVQRFI